MRRPTQALSLLLGILVFVYRLYVDPPCATESAIVFKLGVWQVSICFRVCARQEALDNLQDSKAKLEKIQKFKKIDGEAATYGSVVPLSLKGYIIISYVFS